MGCCGNASSEQTRPGLDQVGKPAQNKPASGSLQANIYTKHKLTGVMNEHCQAQQDDIDQNFDPESMMYSEDNIESKRSELDMQAVYESQQIAIANKEWAD